MPEEASSTFHPPKQEMRPPSSVCCRRVVNVLEGFASVFYISNKSRLLAFAATTKRGLPLEKRRRVNAVINCSTITQHVRHGHSSTLYIPNK